MQWACLVNGWGVDYDLNPSTPFVLFKLPSPDSGQNMLCHSPSAVALLWVHVSCCFEF